MRRKRSLKSRIEQTHGSIRRAKSFPIREEYRIAKKECYNLRRRLQNVMREEIIRKYEKEQPVVDIERQLGEGNGKKETQKPLQVYAFKERSLAIDCLFTFATTSSMEECSRRGKAIDALASLASRQEGRRTRMPKRPAIKIEVTEELLSMDQSALSPREIQFPLKCQPTQCIFCLGQRDLPMTKRMKSFCETGDLKKHFHRKHLKFLSKDEPILCPHPSCDEVLKHVMHLQRHAKEVHKTKT